MKQLTTPVLRSSSLYTLCRVQPPRFIDAYVEENMTVHRNLATASLDIVEYLQKAQIIHAGGEAKRRIDASRK